MATKKKNEATVSPTYQINVPGREVLNELNLAIPSDHGAVREAAAAAFKAVYDGGNAPVDLSVTVGDGSVTVTAVQHPYVHG